ncbi:MAG: hypothetical protein L0L10_04855 [Tetragenococcus sp.]|nr:hypothetical protein [Tetragenococcus sp.]
MLEKTPGWTDRKYQWAIKKEYDDQRMKQYEISAAIQQQLSIVMNSLGGGKNKEVPNILMPSFEEAQKGPEPEKTNEGVDTTKWWEGAERKE